MYLYGHGVLPEPQIIDDIAKMIDFLFVFLEEIISSMLGLLNKI